MIIFHLDCYWQKASILTMLEYYLMTDFLCLAWVGKGGRKGQLIARCRAVGTGGQGGNYPLPHIEAKHFR